MAAHFAHTLPWGAELADGGKLTLCANLTNTPTGLPFEAAGVPFFSYPDDAGASLAQGTLPPWSVVASLTSQE